MRFKFFDISVLKIGGRLHRKVFLMMILVGVLPTVFLGLLALFSLNLAHKIDISSIETNLLNQKIEEIGKFFDDAVGILELKVTFEQVSDIEIDEQHFLLRELLAENPALHEVSFVNLKGKETARHNRFYPAGVSREELQDQSKTRKFLAAKNGGKYVSPAYVTLNGPMVAIAVPVRNRNDIIISVLAGEINLSGLQKLTETSRLGEFGYLYVVDQDGFLVAHSKADIKNLYAVNLADYGFMDHLLEGKESVSDGQARYKSFWGETVVAAGEFLGQYNLGIVAEWPAADADRIVSIIRNQILAISFIVLILCVVLSLFLANRIVGPIKVLEAGTQLIAEGKFDEPVNIVTHDEIEDLGTAFNKMMEGLKRLEELKNEFVFIAAHELRTPVTAIKGYISLTFDRAAGSLDEETKRFLGEVKKASERLTNLVNDLLQIARSEAGRLTIKVSPVLIEESVRGTLAELKVLADEKSIKLVYEPGELPRILADPDRLKEVMVNLVGNALRYTLGAGTITVSHEISESGLVTHVEDTGIGISKDAQKKLFEKFYRVQDERTREITGTGLGLFIVKQIIEKMNGRIWVESEENKGSTFSFSLPIAS